MNVSVSVLLYLVLLSAVLAIIGPLWRSTQVTFKGRKANDFPRSGHDGPAWYLRTLDAHANSLENLALYAGIVVVAYMAGKLAIVDALAWCYLAARLAQSACHLLGTSHWLVMGRFTFWLVQMGLIFYMGVQLVLAA